MPWTEISTGHFQRAIGENEILLKIIGDAGHALGHEHWAINADAAIEPKPTRDQVKRFEKAWKTLRFHHPSIAAVASESHINYEVPDAKSLNAWAAETFVVHEDGALENIAAEMKPSPLASLHIFPKTGEILLHTTHWRTDGIGVLHLLNELFKLAASRDLQEPASLAWGQEISRLAPSIEEAANVPTESNDKIKAEAAKWISTFSEVPGAVGIECSASPDTPPAGTRAIRSTLSEATTDAIVKACKSRTISVTSAVHAALASTNWAFAAEDEKSKHYTSTIRFTLRPYLPEPFRGPKYASGLYTSAYMHTIPVGRSFEENSQEINGLYRKGLNSDFLEAHRQYALYFGDMIRNAPADAPPPRDVDISSLGVIDRMVQPNHGDFEVTGVNVGIELLTRQMEVLLWTFRGKLTFNLVYNEAFYEARTAVAFLEHLKQTLMQELDVHK